MWRTEMPESVISAAPYAEQEQEQEAAPELILMDTVMPVMDGLEEREHGRTS